MRHTPAFLGLCAALLLGAMPRVQASTSAAADDLPQLVRRAEQIFEVEILDQHVEMLANGSIQSVWNVSTVTPIKGAVPTVHEVRLPGGEIANRGLWVPGMPSFEHGDRCILFLSEASEGYGWRVPIGAASGVARVRMDARGGKQVVRPLASHDDSLQVREYEAFLRDVLQEVSKQSTR